MDRARRSWLPIAVALAAGVVLSCREEIVQTASRLPDAGPSDGGTGGSLAPLECQSGAASDQLPPGAAFGEGDVADAWPLVGGSYGPLKGPGLYVVARDTFRVYVNGHLVGQSEQARAPLFVPVTLVPGENVIAVAAHAAAGTPAALIHLDELTREVVSGGDWKLSAAPEGDWTLPGYDDSAWASARDLGAFGGLTGCDPAAFFPASTGARWIGPAPGTEGSVALRTTVRVEPVGFGEGTTGGGDAEPQRVTTWEELEALAVSDTPATILLAEGEHDFRRQGAEVEAVDVCPGTCDAEPGRTVLRVPSSDSTCSAPLAASQRDERVLHLGSNKTILGLGRGAAVRGVSFALEASENVIVRNVAVYGINPHLLEAQDAFTVGPASRLWMDHVTLKWVSDAFLDVFPGTDRVTLSYALFDGGTEGECGGQERWALTATDAQMTIHHSRFDQVSTRAPLAVGSLSRTHLFNNVYSNTADWTVGSDCLAQVLLEGNVFENVEVVSRLSTCDTGERGLMNAPAGSNLYRDGSAVHVGGDGTEPHDALFVPEYDYELEPATDALPRVILRAGAGGPWALPLALE